MINSESSLRLVIPVLLFVGTAQGFLLAGALFSLRRGNATANRILASLLLIFSITIFFHTLAQFRPRLPGEPPDAWAGHSVFLLFGPLMFLYAQALTTKGFRLQIGDSIHLIPFLAFCLLYQLVRKLSLPSAFSGPVGAGLFLFMVAQMLSYLLAVLEILKNHGARIRESFSSLEHINLRWLRLVTMGQIVIWSVAFVVEMFKSDPRRINVVWLLVSAFMYMVGYFGISQPEIFTARIESGESTGTGEKYGKSALSAAEAELILKRLETMMKSEKPYVNAGLTLPLLSKQLSIPVHHLSQVINQHLGKNFFEFINGYRVDEAKRLLVDPKMRNLTLAAIGFEAGFNSVSSFNSIFKKVTSTTPSRYRASAEAAVSPKPAY